MTMDFDSVLSAPRSGRDRAVIIDHHDYAQSVFCAVNPCRGATRSGTRASSGRRRVC